MGKRLNLSGHKFNRLTVIEFAYVDKHGSSHWLCKCDCGQSKIISQIGLANSRIKSCGCLNDEVRRNRFKKHGMTGSKEHITWSAMIARCTNLNHPSWNRYGGRGIKICDRWMKFENFYNDMGPKPKGLTLERINNDGNYNILNCKWATRAEQNRNKKQRTKSRINLNIVEV